MSKRDEAIKSAIEAMDTTFGPGKAGYGRAAAAMTVCADRANRADRGSEEREGMADVIFIIARWIDARHGEDACDAAMDAANWA